SPAPFSTCTTMVRSLGGGCFCWSFGGWGTSASRPFGVSGVITMKTMSSTSKTSIIGVTLMSALGPPPGPPIAIPISNSQLLGASARGGAGCRRLLCRGARLYLLGQQAYIINSGRADIVHYIHHAAVLGTSVGLDEDPLVNLVGQTVLHLRCQLVGLDSVGTEEDLSVAHDGHEQRVFLVGIRHRYRTIDFRHVNAHAMLQHRRDHHENDEQHQHHVHH